MVPSPSILESSELQHTGAVEFMEADDVNNSVSYRNVPLFFYFSNLLLLINGF